jgi:hypothetical protein
MALSDSGSLELPMSAQFFDSGPMRELVGGPGSRRYAPPRHSVESPGRPFGWGPKGRWFKSSRPDWLRSFGKSRQGATDRLPERFSWALSGGKCGWLSFHDRRFTRHRYPSGSARSGYRHPTGSRDAGAKLRERILRSWLAGLASG